MIVVAGMVAMVIPMAMVEWMRWIPWWVVRWNVVWEWDTVPCSLSCRFQDHAPCNAMPCRRKREREREREMERKGERK